MPNIKGVIVAYMPKTEKDGSLTWEALILTEFGELARAPAELVQTWTRPAVSAAAPGAGAPFNIGDQVQIVNSGERGLVLLVNGPLVTVQLLSGVQTQYKTEELALV
jgi:hypothetical protein